MANAQTYEVRIYDTPLAQFQFEKTLGGFRARGLEVDRNNSHLLPLNIMQAPDDVELARFLASRRVPKGRAYLEEILRPYGLAPTDTKGIIDLSRGVSVNDAYSVVPADDDVTWSDCNLFDNDFDEVLQIVAYTGAIPEGVIGTGRPSDLTPSGAFPKTWRRIDGQLMLYKAGSATAAPNYGREPYSEALAWQVAHTMGLDAIPYELTEWRGKLCSVCKLFNTATTSFVPFELCLPSDLIQLCDIELALSYFGNISDKAEEKFRSMAVFDSLIANSDRHIGNFGVLRDNTTGRVLDAAPIFDNNVSLFSRDDDKTLEIDTLTTRADEAPGILDTTLGIQSRVLLGEAQRKHVERLREFTFDDSGFITDYRTEHPNGRIITPQRLNALSAFVRTRASQLLDTETK
ncbi:HipA domain-containing protein [Adlercreutzia sp. ZJ141]|uniref:HipA domain-containing protein n=1 Tax=Adlercreutzia sp. ZJ141 TaxID=2709406 RepID=UPI0013EDD96D|nr:HipA domain-containing protein [Adlercreutzia sp. ZJ141]